MPPAGLWNGWSYARPITLSATPSTALVDQPIDLRVSGLMPGEPVTLRASIQDYKSRTWRAEATFFADDKGVVDVTRDAPKYGSYSGVHAMGLIWSMLPQGVKDPSSALFYLPDGAKLHVTALADQRLLASTDVIRLPRATDIRETKLDSNGLVGVLYAPPQPGPHPTIVIIGGSEGGLHPQVEQAALLASHGYTALGLAYFGAPGLPQQLVKIPLEYFARATDWLKQQPAVDPSHIAIMGWSKGAEAALVLAAIYPQTFHAVIAFAPSSEVWSGINNGPDPITSSWSFDDKPIPFLTFDFDPTMFNKNKISLLMGYMKPLDNQQAVESAAIQVERISGPVLLISGTDDQIWPSSIFSQRIMARLKEHRHAYPDESICYQGAGHYILWPYRPVVTNGVNFGDSTLLLGGQPLAYAFADRDSWNKVLPFLQTALH